MHKILFGKVILFVLFFSGFVHGSSLVVYSVSSLFEYPEYNFAQAFEQFAGLPAGSVQVVRVPDAQLIQEITTSVPKPVPDVVIGIDNIRQYNLPKNTFLAVTSTQIQNVDSHLYAQVSGFNLFPYEYGRVTLIGNKTRIGSKFDPSTLTLKNLASNPDLLKTLIVQDPSKADTGTAFLLSTIATFGDSKVGVQGEVNGTNWQDWWSTVLQYATVANSWTQSWDLFAKNEAYTLLVSYELDPTYYSCTEGENDVVALSLDDDQWYFVEAIGVYNKTANVALAQKFVDWFLSPTVQALLPNHEWMFPARNGVAVPSCFKSVVSPNPEFNEKLSSATLSKNLANWISEWSALKA